MSKQLEIRNSTAEFLIFQAEGKEDGIQVVYKDETIWCTQKAMAALFDVDRSVITKHLKNIFDLNELSQDSVCAIFAHTAEDGKTYNTQFYNLDAIISVGYRVNSLRATQFRQWCTYVLRQFTIRGYVIDKKRMENGSFIGEDYFEHLLAEIREIRLSERRFYQKLTDIYATAIDYNKDAPTTRQFFKMVQNRKPLPKPNLKNTALFKTACFSLTLTSLPKTAFCLLISRRLMENKYHICHPCSFSAP